MTDITEQHALSQIDKLRDTLAVARMRLPYVLNGLAVKYLFWAAKHLQTEPITLHSGAIAAQLTQIVEAALAEEPRAHGASSSLIWIIRVLSPQAELEIEGTSQAFFQIIDDYEAQWGSPKKPELSRDDKRKTTNSFKLQAARKAQALKDKGRR